MRLSSLTYFILMVNSAIDTGKYQDISMHEIEGHIEEGDVISYLQGRLGKDIDLGLVSLDYAPIEAMEITRGLQAILGAHGGSERRKWGVENSGLCLLVAWLTEMVQQRDWED